MFYNISLLMTITFSVVALMLLQMSYPADLISFGFMFASVFIASAFIGNKLARA